MPQPLKPNTLFLAFLLPLLVSQASSAQDSPAPLVLPPGTKIPLIFIRPLFAARAKPGDPLFARTLEPVPVAGRPAIPAGTWVAASIDSLDRPTPRLAKAHITLHLTRLIFPGGYTIPLTEPTLSTTLELRVTPANDLLLDNGTAFLLTLPAPLVLDPTRVASAFAAAKPFNPGRLPSATLCRNKPANTLNDDLSDIDIPANAGDSGTPSVSPPSIKGQVTSIKNGPGLQGTPAIHIPGQDALDGPTPSTCPAPPIVIASLTGPATTASAPTPPASPEPRPTSLTLPQGSVVLLSLLTPIHTLSTVPGTPIRATVAFPYTIGDLLAIPAGATVEGSVTAVTPANPKSKTSNPTVIIEFTRLLYPNGYTIELKAAATQATRQLPQPSANYAFLVTSQPPWIATSPIFTPIFHLYSKKPPPDPTLFDSNWQLQMTLQTPLTLDPSQIEATR